MVLSRVHAGKTWREYHSLSSATHNWQFLGGCFFIAFARYKSHGNTWRGLSGSIAKERMSSVNINNHHENTYRGQHLVTVTHNYKHRNKISIGTGRRSKAGRIIRWRGVQAETKALPIQNDTIVLKLSIICSPHFAYLPSYSVLVLLNPLTSQLPNTKPLILIWSICIRRFENKSFLFQRFCLCM